MVFTKRAKRKASLSEGWRNRGMKFLGVELGQFACFERQFVRLQPGLNLLVGKNNSGKTAILRALPLLRGASASLQPSMEVSLGPYVHAGQAHFDFAVVFEFEPSDQSIFDSAPSFDWRGFVLSRRPVLVHRFRVWPGSNPGFFGFRGTEVLIPGWTQVLPVIEAVGTAPSGSLTSIQYSPPKNPETGPAEPAHRLRRGLSAGNRAPLPDRSMGYTGIAGTPWFQPFDALRRVRLIVPHLVVADSLPLATTSVLAANASDLPTYLQTLQTNQRRKFQRIEEFVVSAFPEFERVNPVSENNKATIRLTRRGTEEDVPFAYCGTGVEQLLALAAVVTASEQGEMVLIDEPHSYLHPVAERALLRFLGEFPDRHFVIATHSSVLINGVAPDRLTHLERPGTPYTPVLASAESSKILHDLGYRNSDALFFDRLVIVEGPSDADILRCLIALSHRVRPDVLQNTGFPSIDGVDDRALEIQTKILRFEKLLEALGRAKMPRMYLLDGDREPDDVALLAGTNNPVTGERVNVKFLPRTEIENYLLVPEAITQAVAEEASLAEVDVDAATLDAVRAELEEQLRSDDEVLFPRGRDRRMEQVKGSKLLQRLYNHFEHLRYDKNRSGQMIARNLTAQNAIGLNEIIDCLDVLASA
jgi:hypothetical protein